MDSQSLPKRVAIIGAGPSGLAAAKEALDNGLHPTVFEKAAEIGGVWELEHGAAWDNMTTDTSHFITCFSDFPFSEGIGLFPTKHEIYQYIIKYATHFNLYQHIKLQTPVKNISQSGSKWLVTYSSNGVDTTEEFEFAIVASGMFSKPRMPQMEGLDKFKGPVLFARDYKKPEQIRGNRVVVIGGSFSGSQLALDLIKQEGKTVLNLIGDPRWVTPTCIPDQSYPEKPLLPAELVNVFKYSHAEVPDPPSLKEASRKVHEALKAGSIQDQICPDLKVPESAFDWPPKFIISNTYLDKIQAGKIKVRRCDISCFDEKGVYLQDGTYEEADAVVVCAGYYTEIPFLDDKIKKSLEYDPSDNNYPVLTYKSTFTPEFKNLGFIGLSKFHVFASLELQARWIIQVFSQKVNYPSLEDMQKGIEELRVLRSLKLKPAQTLAGFSKFMVFVAKQIGALPDVEVLEKENPELAELYKQKKFIINVDFRITGPGCKPEIAAKGIKEFNKFLEVKLAEGQLRGQEKAV